MGYEQEHWKNPASVHVIRPEDISLNGHVLTVDAFRNVAGMYTTRGVGYDDFVTMRNFSGSATEKFLTMVDGREVLQLMGTINWTTEDVPLAILDRVEIIRGPGASIWGTKWVSGVVNIVTKHAAQTQGDSVRLIIEDDGTFLGNMFTVGKSTMALSIEFGFAIKNILKESFCLGLMREMMVMPAKQDFVLIKN